MFARKSAVSPYITFGAGYLDNDYYIGSGRSGPLAQAGLGLMIDIAQNDAKTFVLQLRPEVKMRYDWAESPKHDTFPRLHRNRGTGVQLRPAAVCATTSRTTGSASTATSSSSAAACRFGP